jgi:predicted Rossmann-fold nucleotide-binding protein
MGVKCLHYDIGHIKLGTISFPDVNVGDYRPLKKSPPVGAARIGVFGSAFDGYDSAIINLDGNKEKSIYLGELIAQKGLVQVNGACSGIPDFAAYGSALNDGTVVGFSAFKDEKSHLEAYKKERSEVYQNIIVFTGESANGEQCRTLRYKNINLINRNLLNVVFSDMVVAVDGSYGTNNEISIAAEMEYIIGFLKGSGGVGSLGKQYYESIRKQGNGAVFIEEENPNLLLEMMIEEHNKRKKSDRESMGKDVLDIILEREYLGKFT